MRIIKDALPKPIFEKLQADVFKPGFAWYCYEQPHYAEEFQLYGPTYAHMALVNGQVHSPIADDLVAYLKTIIEANGNTVMGVSKVIVECLNGTQQSVRQLYHVDLTEDHKIGYLFLNDNDGALSTFNYWHETGGDDFYKQFKDAGELTERDRILPTANTFVEFDGLQYHADSTPTNANRRIVVSYCYKTE